jgi:hypothetical protein
MDFDLVLESPDLSQKALDALGPLTRAEWIVLVVFAGMVCLALAFAV